MELENRLYTRREAARLLGCSEAALRRWEGLGSGPRVTRLGRLVRFSPESIREFVERNSQAEQKEETH